jgi:cyclopropane fatty-acyl-phospholipid synthase-like methyltransferase
MSTLIAEHIKPTANCRILDIGCGPGTAIPYLGACDYTGLDMSEDYVESARKRFPAATFHCNRVNQYQPAANSKFDRALALGVVHHLDDAEALRLFETAYEVLKPGGRLITVDGVFEEGQSRIARFLLQRDRGEFVRCERQYRKIAEKVFPSVVVRIRHDLIRIPYSHIVMECNR